MARVGTDRYRPWLFEALTDHIQNRLNSKMERPPCLLLTSPRQTSRAFPQGTGAVTLSIQLHYVNCLVHNIGRKRQF